MRSLTLHTVPIMTWAPFSSCSICRLLDCPPNAHIDFIYIYLDSSNTSSLIWWASSLVGARMSTCGTLFLVSIAFNTGRQKAAVFPVPVCDCPTMCLPLENASNVFNWISVGVSYHFFSNAWMRYLFRSKSANFLPSMGASTVSSCFFFVIVIVIT